MEAACTRRVAKRAPGETDGTGTTVDNDADDDGVCDADEVAGCQDSSACNYNASATDADSCTYATETCATCSGETDGTGTVVDNDADDDGVCDADEIPGCQSLSACNYNDAATDDDSSCIYPMDSRNMLRRNRRHGHHSGQRCR